MESNYCGKIRAFKKTGTKTKTGAETKQEDCYALKFCKSQMQNQTWDGGKQESFKKNVLTAQEVW